MTKCPGDSPWIPEVFSCMQRLRSNDKDWTEQTLESGLKKSLALKVRE